MAQTNKPNQQDVTLPIMAAAALGTNPDPALQALITGLLQDFAEKRQKEKARELRLRESAVQSAKEEKQAREAKQNSCPHTKQDGETRLGGQRLSGTGQISLVCQFCGKDFFLPPLEGQEAPPRHLIPSMDAIGG